MRLCFFAAVKPGIARAIVEVDADTATSTLLAQNPSRAVDRPREAIVQRQALEHGRTMHHGDDATAVSDDPDSSGEVAATR
jgi:hypothetical protein